MQEKIIIGIDENSDIDALLNDNIRQFYFGYISADFQEAYATQHGLNRRYRLSEQFTSLEHAYQTIETIHAHGGRVYLALNTFGANAVMMAEAKRLFGLFAQRVDGIIVANVAMAQMLKSERYDKIVTSNLFGVYTPQAVAFLQKHFAPEKIILPRDIALDDIAHIVTAYPKQDFECFLYGDNCRYSESFCFVEHGYDSVGFGSLCRYATAHKKPVRAAVPSFRQVSKDAALTHEEKRAFFAKEALDIASLIDACIEARYSGAFETLHKKLEMLGRYDVAHFTTTLKLRTVDMLQGITTPTAQTLLKRLSAYQPQEDESYRRFHKLNASAIAQTVAFFQRYENIVSYKIPSRGRAHHRHLHTVASDEPYNYTQSQYKL